MPEFIKIAKKAEIPANKIKEFNIRGKTVAVANSDGEYLAFDGMCTHQQCSLAGGFLDGKTLTCYCHGGQFDIKTGEVLAPPPPSPLHVYKVRVEKEEIFIEI